MTSHEIESVQIDYKMESEAGKLESGVNEPSKRLSDYVEELNETLIKSGVDKALLRVISITEEGAQDILRIVSRNSE